MIAAAVALALLLLQGVVVAREGSGITWKRFADRALGIEFSYASDRKVVRGCHDSKACVALVGAPMPESEYLVAFEVFDGDLDTVAVERSIFAKAKDGWTARGRFAEHPAVPLTGRGWRGITSVVGCGISDRAGSHPGAGECLWAVLSNGKRSVVVDTQGIVGNDEHTRRSIESLRFTR